MSLNGSHQLQMVQKHEIDFAAPNFDSFRLAVLQKSIKKSSNTYQAKCH